MNIRPAELDDIPSIFDIERAVFRDAVYPVFFLRQAIDLWGRFLLVAENDDDIAGTRSPRQPTTRALRGYFR